MKIRIFKSTLKITHLVKAKPIIFLSIVFFLVVFSQSNLFSAGNKNNATDLGSEAFQNEHPNREYWSQRIDRSGTAAAYLEFKAQALSRSLGIQHSLAHFIGELIYNKSGISGFLTCDTEFNYGCYHGFFSAVLGDKGLPVLKDLNKSCEDKYGTLSSPCKHGIGHGLLSYFGRNKLSEALSYCHQTNQQDPRNGCSAGVFMEYNISTHFAASNGVNDIRALNTDNPHEPCNTTVAKEFRQSCYFEIGLWWREVYTGDFTKIGRLCQEISVPEERDACFVGLGIVIAPTTNYNAGEVIALCKKMPDLDGELKCRSGAYGVFNGLEVTKELAPKICEDVPTTKLNQCAKN